MRPSDSFLWKFDWCPAGQFSPSCRLTTLTRRTQTAHSSPVPFHHCPMGARTTSRNAAVSEPWHLIDVMEGVETDYTLFPSRRRPKKEAKVTAEGVARERCNYAPILAWPSYLPLAAPPSGLDFSGPRPLFVFRLREVRRRLSWSEQQRLPFGLISSAKYPPRRSNSTEFQLRKPPSPKKGASRQ